ncbi:hypothetical protein [Capillimicrobium parvum]|uniref:Uncharacterized protein n=1 Tax=Capillimicrobium parvum TaxID=2884022 RepID=A0A9E6XXZ8_9ACTN|nr:hypothetical protein [Capillimicrobium parvum]UGS35871.1 hypothetical protein DSM104329_02268 [Capillimicrobium parvum]
MDLPWNPSIVALDAVQAALVALPAAGLPRPLARLGGRWWALIPPASIVAVVFGITALPGLADGLTWLALIACPPLAAVALGWAMHGARPVYAVAVLPLGAAAWIWSGELGGHLCALALTALSCVTLARLLRGVAPAMLLKLGILAMATADAILILSEQLQQPNSTLVAARPAAELPRLQVAIIDPASMGYGDLFLAAVLGAVVAAEVSRRAQAGVAVLVLVLAVAFDALFLVLDTLPATVPVALALLVYEAVRRQRRRGRVRRRTAPMTAGAR